MRSWGRAESVTEREMETAYVLQFLLCQIKLSYIKGKDKDYIRPLLPVIYSNQLQEAPQCQPGCRTPGGLSWCQHGSCHLSQVSSATSSALHMHAPIPLSHELPNLSKCRYNTHLCEKEGK